MHGASNLILVALGFWLVCESQRIYRLAYAWRKSSLGKAPPHFIQGIDRNMCDRRIVGCELESDAGRLYSANEAHPGEVGLCHLGDAT